MIWRRSSIRNRIRRAVRITHSSTGNGRSGWLVSELERPIDKVMLELARVDFAHRPAARRLAGFVDCLPASGDQIMPLRQSLPSGAKPIGACVRQPVELAKVAAVQ